MVQAMRDINNSYRETPALWQLDDDPWGFEWIDPNDAANNIFTWLRRDASGGTLACAVNFSPVPRIGYRMGLPHAGRWREIMNTDATAYGGSGMGNFGEVQAQGPPWHHQETSVDLTIPPLATVWLRHEN